TTNRIRSRWVTVETGALCRDGLVFRGSEIAGPRIVGFDLEGFTWGDTQKRFVPPIKGVFSGLFAGNALHDWGSAGASGAGYSTLNDRQRTLPIKIRRKHRRRGVTAAER